MQLFKKASWAYIEGGHAETDVEPGVKSDPFLMHPIFQHISYRLCDDVSKVEVYFQKKGQVDEIVNAEHADDDDAWTDVESESETIVIPLASSGTLNDLATIPAVTHFRITIEEWRLGDDETYTLTVENDKGVTVSDVFTQMRAAVTHDAVETDEGPELVVEALVDCVYEGFGAYKRTGKTLSTYLSLGT
ncbi:hypothetical protein FB45DRAFT_1031581 [Roridomyces roridus]|uniref:DUF6699 domain-containing protein n=1 Tax=Roridomyces roridus TaxID=1738132 RepID=A0AAD7BKX6_9AGAR|nr:hypothetical protein FB45DRAFT_1031581 [Roridomyces roridus]